MIKFNNKTVKKIYAGDEQVNRLKNDTDTIFQYYDVEKPYDEQYLTFEAVDDYYQLKITKSINYSTDNGRSWRLGSEVIIQKGEKVLIKASGLTTSYRKGVCQFRNRVDWGDDSHKRCKVYGNVMSLIYGDDFVGKEDISSLQYTFYSLFGLMKDNLVDAKNLILPATTLSTGCYTHMFNGCTNLTTAPELPATTLTNEGYSAMFAGCTSLTVAPELPATTLAGSCYTGMFEGCTNLTTAPALPATTLASNCYLGMFLNCTSLTTAPELLAESVYRKDGCYGNMFSGCTSLNYIKMLATDTSRNARALNNWVNGVSVTGTFVKNASATLPTGVNGIPDGWTVVDA